MQIVIDMPDKMYQKILKNEYDYGIMNVIIQNGTPLPKNHGDLIDRSKLLKKSYEAELLNGDGIEVVDSYEIEDAPTIIEAEKEKEK